MCIRGFRTYCIILNVALLRPTYLSGANFLIITHRMASVGLVSFDSCDNFIPASGSWILVFSFIRVAGLDLKRLLSYCPPV